MGVGAGSGSGSGAGGCGIAIMNVESAVTVTDVPCIRAADADPGARARTSLPQATERWGRVRRGTNEPLRHARGGDV